MDRKAVEGDMKDMDKEALIMVEDKDTDRRAVAVSTKATGRAALTMAVVMAMEDRRADTEASAEATRSTVTTEATRVMETMRTWSTVMALHVTREKMTATLPITGIRTIPVAATVIVTVTGEEAIRIGNHAYICLLYTSPSPRDRG